MVSSATTRALPRVTHLTPNSSAKHDGGEHQRSGPRLALPIANGEIA